MVELRISSAAWVLFTRSEATHFVVFCFTWLGPPFTILFVMTLHALLYLERAVCRVICAH